MSLKISGIFDDDIRVDVGVVACDVVLEVDMRVCFARVDNEVLEVVEVVTLIVDETTDDVTLASVLEMLILAGNVVRPLNEKFPMLDS